MSDPATTPTPPTKRRTLRVVCRAYFAFVLVVSVGGFAAGLWGSHAHFHDWLGWLDALSRVVNGEVVLGETGAAWIIVAAATGTVGLIGVPYWYYALITWQYRRWPALIGDVLLLALTIYAISRLPAAVESRNLRDVLGPFVRLMLEQLFAIRLLVRVVPAVLSAVERSGFRSLVAVRLLRERNRRALSVTGWLTTTAVAISAWALTIVLSVLGGLRMDVRRKILGSNAHVAIDRPRGTISDWRTLAAEIRAMPGVRGVSPTIAGEVMVTSATQLSPATLRGIDPVALSNTTALNQQLRAGGFEYLRHPERLLSVPFSDMGEELLFEEALPRRRRASDDDAPRNSFVRELPPPTKLPAPPFAGDAGVIAASDGGARSPRDAGMPDELEVLLHDIHRALDTPDVPKIPRAVYPGIIIGQEMQRALRVVVGDEINVVSPLGGGLGPSGPLPKVRAFRVAGIFRTRMYEYDAKHAYVLLSVGQEFHGKGDVVTSMELRLTSLELAPGFARRFNARFGSRGLRARPWQELNQNLFGALATERIVTSLTLGLAVLCAGFCVLATVSLLVREKRTAIGVLKALGSTDGRIAQVFLLQGAVIGAVGSTIGIAMGWVYSLAIERFAHLVVRLDTFYITRLPVVRDPGEISLVALSGIVMATLATLVPAYVGGRTRPIEAIHDR